MTTFVGDSNANTFTGGTGADSAFGNAGNDTLTGGAGDDSLDGGSNNDVLNGGDGFDHINGSTGADTMSGGLGNDTYAVDNAADVVVERSGEGTDNINYSLAGSFTLPTGIENGVAQGVGSTVATHITGTSSNNYLQGNAAGNLLRGLGGNDTVFGGTGADTLDGGAGDDLLQDDSAGFGTSNTTYIFGRGYGRDVIQDTFDVNTVRFGSGIAANQLLFFTDAAGNPSVNISGTNDTLRLGTVAGTRSTIAHYFLSDGTEVFPTGSRAVRRGAEAAGSAAAGVALDEAQALVQAMASFAPPATASAAAATAAGLQLQLAPPVA